MRSVYFTECGNLAKKGLWLICLFLTSISYGQSKLELVVGHLEKEKVSLNLTGSDLKDLSINSEVTTNKGITYMYLNQTINNVPIRNAIMTVIMDKNDKVVSSKNTFVNNAASKVLSNKQKITMETAIVNSARHLGFTPKSVPISLGRKDSDNMSYSFLELSKTPIASKLMYELVNGHLFLVWNMQIDMIQNADYWDINIDATTGEFVSKKNYTIYCQHHKNEFVHHDNCKEENITNYNNEDYCPEENMLDFSGRASYNVFEFPVESPNHGARSIAFDDKYPTASPYGWHDTNGIDGAEYTTTRGNNVHAYEDKDDDDLSDGPLPDGGSALSFYFPLDPNLDPRESANAAVTNLFYAVNMIHDLTALVGFTEEFGNFQEKNYTNSQGNGDYVLAQAFDGITVHEAGNDLDENNNPTKINNANFATPQDGFNGTMQMYLWDNKGGSISVDSPELIAGFINSYGNAAFGGRIPVDGEAPITRQVAIVNDGSAEGIKGCNPIVNANQIAGKIALIERGICDFSKKVYRAQVAGAVAAVVCNIVGVNGGSGEELLDMGGGDNAGSVTIPSVFLKKSDCDKIKLVLSNNQAVTMTFFERERMGAAYLDGSLDNGIIAHEFAHGISNRLTGGRTNASCLGNDEQMGEGWSDFFALISTQKPTDKGDNVRGIGTFATAQQVTGGGIRRYPYSTDMNINPQTYDNIKATSSPHQLGEVWADMLWDMYWAFIDLYGYNADWTNESSGNFKAVFLVMEGMKMQPCSPGFIQGRDAILSADKLHFGGEHQCMLWSVFARRGLGFYAEGGSTADRNDGVEDFEPLPTCIEALKIAKTATASVNAGDEVTVTLKTVNHIPTTQNSVIVTDELPSGMTYIAGSSSSVEPTVMGNMIRFDLGDLAYEQEVILTYKIKTSPLNTSVRLLYDDFEADITWDIEKNKGTEDWALSRDVYHSFETSFYVLNLPLEIDASLVSIPYLITGNNPVVRFWHKYDTEAGSDGGFVEVSVDGGPYAIVPKDKFIRNGYTNPIAYTTLAIPELYGFTGTSNGEWIDSYIDLSDYKGRNVVFRFRFGSDDNTISPADAAGWYIDDFELIDVFKYTAQACIAAEDGMGATACTDAIQTLVNSGGISAANETEKDYFSLILAPNPAGEYVVINTTAPYKTAATVDILNMSGSAILHQNISIPSGTAQNVINTTALASGIYIVKIQSGDKTSIKKLVIN